MKLTFARPAPTIVTLGGVIEVTDLLDMPLGFDWRGVFVDANLRAIETVRSERQKDFMLLSALQGSILENRLFEEDFEVESISTAKLFQWANKNGIAILTINKSNVNALLPTLPFDDNKMGCARRVLPCTLRTCMDLIYALFRISVNPKL
jgi:hypothetical protein